MKFIIILLFLSLINFLLGDTLGSLIIVVIGIISALIRFFQDYSVYKFNRKLKELKTSDLKGNYINVTKTISSHKKREIGTSKIFSSMRKVKIDRFLVKNLKK